MFRFVVYRVFWLGVFGALIAVGAPMVGRPKSALPLVDLGRDGSVNSVLSRTLGEPDLAPAITEWLDRLPRGKPVLVVAPPDQLAAALSADLVSYLAWPRPVVVSSEPERSKMLLKNHRERFAALGVCYLPPPPGAAQVKSFGSALTFIPSEPLAE